MGIVLFFIASVLWLPATFVNIIAVMISEVRSRGFIRVIDSYFTETAIDIDRFGNRNFRTLLSIQLIEKSTNMAKIKKIQRSENQWNYHFFCPAMGFFRYIKINL